MAVLARQVEMLRTAFTTWSNVRREVAHGWGDEVFREIDQRYLEPIATEHRHLMEAITFLQKHLDEVGRVLDGR